MSTYWKSIDAALHFNIAKKEEFLIREKFRSLQPMKRQNQFGAKSIQTAEKRMHSSNDTDAGCNPNEGNLFHSDHHDSNRRRFKWVKPKVFIPALPADLDTNPEDN